MYHSELFAYNSIQATWNEGQGPENKESAKHPHNQDAPPLSTGRYPMRRSRKRCGIHPSEP